MTVNLKTIDYYYQKAVRENIKKLSPYRSAREEYDGEAEIYLDANENPFETGYNRYPDPLQNRLKRKIAYWKDVNPNNIFLGNGSDEIIDLAFRAFCRPEHDEILTINPSYGMYQVQADIQDIKINHLNLDIDFSLEEILSSKSYNNYPKSKIFILCSPNNPTGNAFPEEQLIELVDQFDGIVLIDEAYIDFSSRKSMLHNLSKHPNLIISQTFSKAIGHAAIRLGMAFMHEKWVQLFSSIKLPYNIGLPTQELGLKIDFTETKKQVSIILEEKEYLNNELKKLELVINVYPSDANFLLVKLKDSDQVFDYLLNQGIVVRKRNKMLNCQDALRITIGTHQENKKLISALNQWQKSHTLNH